MFAGHDAGVNSVAFSPDGLRGLSGSSDGTLSLWDVATGKEIRSFAGSTFGVNSVAFSPDGLTAR
jgi:WD40 repeat protein